MAVARWLIALWFIGLAGLNSGIAAVEVTASPHLSLVGQVDLCVDPAGQQTIETVVARDCPFTPATTADLARGFDPGVLWLRLTLVNPTPQPVERWLTIGHPRLRSVQLFERSRPEAPWRRLATGTAVPAAQRPVQTTYPVLPLTLPPDATQTVYVRVASITSIDLTPTLWEPLPYLNAIHAIDLAHVATIGGVLLMALLSGLIFWQMRERMYLYFGLALFGYLVSEGAHSGLLPLYLWPAGQPFYTGLQSLGVGWAMLFLLLFVREYLGRTTWCGDPWLHRLLWGVAGGTWLAVAWSVLVDYRSGARIWTIGINAALLVALLLFIRAWRDGSRPAGQLLLGFLAIVLMEGLRLAVAFGGLPFTVVQVVGGPWGVMLTTPLILAGIAQRSRELREQLLRAEAENQARTRFLAQMSHELRTPLNTVIGAAHLLARGSIHLPLAEGLANILHSSRHLLTLIDQILDYARGQTGPLPLHLEPVNWEWLTQALEQNGRILAQASGNHFVMQVAGESIPPLFLDAGKLRQVIDNLLVNAARHTQHGQIELFCIARRLQPDHGVEAIQLTFVVADNGPGIPLADQARVFLPFAQGLQNAGSMGLGLAIARQWVEMMGGQLDLESRLSQGCRFSFSIECTAAPAVNDPISRVTRLDEVPCQTTLQTMIQQGRVSDIVTWALQLERTHPERQEYAAQVRRAALHLDFAALAKLASSE